NVLCKVVDPETHEEVEPGEIGQVCYRGPTMFEGYYRMDERTDDAFEDGYFVSGVLVRRGEDGVVAFVGRVDDMIVSGGENVYPTEIEECLYEHPAVESVAVVGTPDETWGERIKAAVVLDESEDVSVEELQQHVSERLADFKNPR